MLMYISHICCSLFTVCLTPKRHWHMSHKSHDWSQVNVLTGKAGWHKRINRDFNSLSKRTKLTDDVEISEGAVDKIHTAAKNVVLKRKAATVALPGGHQHSSCSREPPAEWSAAPSMRADDATEKGQLCYHLKPHLITCFIQLTNQILFFLTLATRNLKLET